MQQLQIFILKLVMQCQQSQQLPIPYTSGDCRHSLYHALLSCLLTHPPQVLSPVHHAVRLFSLGLQDKELKVRCARVIVNKLISFTAHAIDFPTTFTTMYRPHSDRLYYYCVWEHSQIGNVWFLSFFHSFQGSGGCEQCNLCTKWHKHFLVHPLPLWCDLCQI